MPIDILGEITLNRVHLTGTGVKDLQKAFDSAGLTRSVRALADFSNRLKEIGTQARRSAADNNKLVGSVEAMAVAFRTLEGNSGKTLDDLRKQAISAAGAVNQARKAVDDLLKGRATSGSIDKQFDKLSKKAPEAAKIFRQEFERQLPIAIGKAAKDAETKFARSFRTVQQNASVTVRAFIGEINRALKTAQRGGDSTALKNLQRRKEELQGLLRQVAGVQAEPGGKRSIQRRLSDRGLTKVGLVSLAEENDRKEKTLTKTIEIQRAARTKLLTVLNRQIAAQRDLIRVSESRRGVTSGALRSQLADLETRKSQLGPAGVSGDASKVRLLQQETAERTKQTSALLKQSDLVQRANRADQARARLIKLLTAEAKKVRSEQIRVTEEIRKQDRLLAIGNKRLSARESLLRRQQRLFVSADPLAAARQRLGVSGGSGDPLKDFDSNKIRNLTRDSKELTGSIDGFNRNRLTLESFGKSAALALKRYGAFLIGSFGILRIIQAFREATKASLDFERNVTKLAQVLDLTKGQITGISIELQTAAAQFGTDVNELAEGVFIFAQAGFKSVAELDALAKELVKIPLTATFGDIKSTAEGLLAIFGQFNIEASETARVLDLVNQFARDFAVESQDIFEAVKRGGAAFSTAGGDVEEFIALFSILREGTRESASTLGTFFRTGIGRLLGSGSQALMKQIGVTALDTVGQLEQLSAILVGPDSPFTNIERINISRQLVGQRQFSRLGALLRELQDPRVGARIARSFAEAGGSLDRAVLKRLDDIGQSFAKIQVAFNKFIDAIVRSDSFKVLAENIASITVNILALASTLKDAIPLLTLLGVAAAAPLLRRVFVGGVGLLSGGGGVAGRRGLFQSQTGRGLIGAPIPIATGGTRRNTFGRRALGAVDRGVSTRFARGSGLLGLALAGPLLQQAAGPTSSLSVVGSALTGGFIGGIGGGVAGGVAGPHGAAIGTVVGAVLGAIGGVITGFKALERATTSLAASTIASPRDILGTLGGVEGRQVAGLGRVSSLSELLVEQGADFAKLSVADIQKALSKSDLGSGFSNIVNDEFTRALQDVKITFRESGKDAILSAEEVRTRAEALTRTRLIERGFDDPSIESGFPGLGLLPQVISAITAPFKTVEIRSFKGIPQDFTNVADALKDNLLLISQSLNLAARNVDEFNDKLDLIITNPATLQTIRAPRGEGVFDFAGFDNIASFLDNNRALAATLGQFITSQRGVIQGFLDIQTAKSDVVNIEAGGAGLIKAIGTVGKELSESEIANLTEQFGPILDELLSKSGLGVAEFLTQALSTNNLEKFTLSVRGLDGVLEDIAKQIRSDIDLFNRTLQLRQQLAASQLTLNNSIFQFSQNLQSLRDTLADRSTQFGQSRNQGAGILNLQERAEGALGRAGRGGGGVSTSQLIQDALDASIRRDEALRNQQGSQLAGGGTLQDAEKAANESLDAQIAFTRAQQLINQRLSELSNRITNAAKAADLFDQALRKSEQELTQTGAQLLNITSDSLIDIFRVFGQFAGAGGIGNTQAGLSALSGTDIDTLLEGLRLAGGFNLGGGISGADILGNIQRDLAIPFLAQLRSSISGQSAASEEGNIVSELAKLEADRNKALEEEKRLRQEQISLVETQKRLAERQFKFIEEQKVLLNDIAAQISANDDLALIRDQTKAIFGEVQKITKTLADALPGGTAGTTEAIAPPQIFEDIREANINSLEALGTLNAVFTDSNGVLTNLLDLVATHLPCVCEKLTEISEQMSEGILTRLEIAPIQVNVALSVPDIIKTIGPAIKTSIMNEIGGELARIFGDEPDRSSQLSSLGGEER